MSDFGTLKTQIASEINRTDIDTLIGTAIQTAIRRYQENKVRWSQVVDTTQVTIASNENLSLPANYFSIDSIRMTYGTNDDAILEIISWADMQDQYSNVTTGRPSAAAIYGGVAKLRAIPNAIYTTVISGYQTFTIPSSSGDTNVWMTYAEDLIKWGAKAFLYGDILEDQERAVYFDAKAKDELTSILAIFSAETQSNQLSYN